ncbi:ThiS family protein [Botrimarina colliarenosi]|uniref:ThiS family protein n=1 Tax=Botrimarina colliarenosi TaxID=2528001 RepID=A0A5C6ADQ5_9BACT|nr:MoaD/ThiS family protein [Botrimarina colliarenosi]TWT98182.1 ThiS family protein [Botrimarina colliarenosi]
MRVSVLLFGPQATLAGARSVDVDVAAESPTANDILAALREASPALTGSLAMSRLAVNHEFAAPDRPIGPGDEVALIGMVSGG